jgi:putative DNA primase/helicase
MDMSMTALLRRAGFTYADTKALLLGWRHGAGAEHADDDRYFRRMWERGVMREEGPGIHHGESRPLIRHIPGNIQQIVDSAERALIGAELDFYQRGSFLVRPGVAPLDISDGRKTTSQQLISVGDHALREALDTAASWEKFDKRSEDWVAIDAPMTIAKTYKDRIGRWQLPVITGIISAPTLRPDGSILQEPGYDRSTGLLLDT